MIVTAPAPIRSPACSPTTYPLLLQLLGLGIGVNWIPGDVATSFSVGADWAFYSNAYDWRCFAVALGCSTAGMLLWSAGALALRRFAGGQGAGGWG
jgi:hypothetical protein